MAMPIGDTAGADEQPMLDINTTPLIDVMLVLLVMLIITIPIQLHAVNMTLPVGRPTANPTQPDKITIHIDATDTVTWQGSPVGPAEIERLMQQAASRSPQPEVDVRADAAASYAAFAHVMAASRRQHLDRMAVLGAEQFVH